jgi:DNA-directed RNA polymerase subunit RPC12/RpoP
MPAVMSAKNQKAYGETPTMNVSGRILFVRTVQTKKTESTVGSRKESPMECPNCGSQIVGDLFEEMWLYWCPTCGKEYHEDLQICDEADIPGVERESELS